MNMDGTLTATNKIYERAGNCCRIGEANEPAICFIIQTNSRYDLAPKRMQDPWGVSFTTNGTIFV